MPSQQNTIPAQISVIYVAYRTAPELLRKSIESIRKSEKLLGEKVEVVIVNNGTFNPEYLDLDPAGSSENFKVIDTGENLGFGAGVNRGVSTANGQNILMMNPDSIVDIRALSELKKAHRDRKHTLVGTLLLNNGKPQVHAYFVWWSSLELLLKRKFWEKSLQSMIKTSTTTEVERLCGAGLYASKSTLQSLGPFDEDFFLYSEDVDLSLRAKQKNYRLILAPTAVVLHDAGTSSGEGPSSLVEQARTDAFFRLCSKHKPYIYSLYSRTEFSLATVVGLIGKKKNSKKRMARASRLHEIKRWGFHRSVSRFDPNAPR